MRLYSYWRSSSAYRARIALNLKGLEYELVPVHLVRDGGEQHGAAYRRINPQALVPSLEHDTVVITQSMAIVEYLDECWPAPPLLPPDPAARARVRAIAQSIACEIQPLNNLRVLQELERRLGADKEQVRGWYRHWVEDGFCALETRLAADAATGDFCHGDSPGLADAFLVPQVYNARRFDCDVAAFPTISRIDANCATLSAFINAAPEKQPDAS